jgi:toxin ParE1/3/4
MAVIIFSLIAKNDLKSIFDYIGQNSKVYAKKEVIAITLTTKKLKANRYLGKRFEKYDDENIRELIFKNYRIVYELAQEKIIILTIHHHARLLSNNPALTDGDS